MEKDLNLAMKTQQLDQTCKINSISIVIEKILFAYFFQGTYWSTANFIGAKMEIIASNGLRHDIRTLSGGEKCILAMSFILAVQRNSLGKVFLFDELDQVNKTYEVIGKIYEHVKLFSF